jgi:hypothetical protein
MEVTLVDKIYFRKKIYVYVLAENKSFDFLQVLNQPVGILNCCFKCRAHYIILVMRIIEKKKKN